MGIEEYEIIVDSMPTASAVAQWEAWCRRCDTAEIPDNAIRIDTGRSADGGEFRRYLIHKSAVHLIKKPGEKKEPS